MPVCIFRDLKPFVNLVLSDEHAAVPGAYVNAAARSNKFRCSCTRVYCVGFIACLAAPSKSKPEALWLLSTSKKNWTYVPKSAKHPYLLGCTAMETCCAYSHLPHYRKRYVTTLGVEAHHTQHCSHKHVAI